MRHNYLKFSKRYLKLDLTTEVLPFQLPPECSWFLIKEKNKFKHTTHLEDMCDTHNHLIERKRSIFASTISREDVQKFLDEGNHICLLTYESTAIAWVWCQTDQNILLYKEDFPIRIPAHRLYLSHWFFKRRFVLNRNQPYLSQAWIQALKTYHQRKGFKEAVAYVDNFNKGALKSLLKAGFEEKDWLAD